MLSAADLRQTYTHGHLDEAETPADPLALFAAWFADALASGTSEPNAMTLATVDASGQPAARIVLLKELDAVGFVFFTNYGSRKGTAIAHEPRVALTFWWPPLERQVRVEGRAERLEAAASEAYFHVRPRGSQLGAVASPQSQVVPDRATLDARLAEAAATFEGRAVERPADWGGYRVVPSAVEFWQGRPNRLHDRLRYTRQGADWSKDRLAP